MKYKIDDIPKIVGKMVYIETINNHFYHCMLKKITGVQLELAFPKRYSEHIYISAIRYIADDKNDIRLHSGMFWIV